MLIPRHNEKDLVELPAEVKADLTFRLVDTLDDVVPRLFEAKPVKSRRKPDPLKAKTPPMAAKSPKIAQKSNQKADFSGG